MTDLTSQDMHALLESISVLNSDLTLETLHSRVFRAISNCVDNDINGLDGWKSNGEFTGRIQYDPDEAVPMEMMEVFGAYAADHPLLLPIVIEKFPGSLKVSDYVTRRQFHRTALYNEFYKEVGIGEQLIVGLEVTPNLMVTSALNRDHSDFSERDRAIFDLLRPHLAQAFKNTYAFNGVATENHYLHLTALRGLIVLDREGKIKYIDNRSIELAQKYFVDFRRDVLPHDLHVFVQSQLARFGNGDYFVPIDEFRVRFESSELCVKVGFDFDAEELRLLLEEKTELAPRNFLPLGLTKRESEILCWIAKGKSDDVIAVLCGISTRTVQKHVEHIFQKLHVENRTAAVTFAQGFL